MKALVLPLALLAGCGPKADLALGEKLYAQHCAVCHALHGEGGKVGPDLTTADRKNREHLIASTVDPSSVVRPGSRV